MTAMKREEELTVSVKAALRAYAEASKGEKCPICAGTESCDHTVKERLSASLIPTEGDYLPDDIESYFRRQMWWSENTFGPALRTKGVIDHIRKELKEIERKPHDLSEWIDVVILAMDGFWRHGGKADGLLPALLAKQRKNMARDWPDWRTMSEDSAIEHDRSKDEPEATECGAHEKDEDFIGYVMRYGGRCRDCADADGTCPTSGLPCDPNIVRPIVAKTINALRYGVENGFINNPLLPKVQTEGGGE